MLMPNVSSLLQELRPQALSNRDGAIDLEEFREPPPPLPQLFALGLVSPKASRGLMVGTPTSPQIPTYCTLCRGRC